MSTTCQTCGCDIVEVPLADIIGEEALINVISNHPGTPMTVWVLDGMASLVMAEMTARDVEPHKHSPSRPTGIEIEL